MELFLRFLVVIFVAIGGSYLGQVVFVEPVAIWWCGAITMALVFLIMG